MYKKLIDKIVWWIPFKNIRNLIRTILINLLDIDNKMSNIDNKMSNIDNKMSNIINNIIISGFTDITYSANIKDYKYDIIFSIGENCFTADILSKNNLRKESSPFDWVTPWDSTNNNIINNLEIIRNRFRNFFNKEDLKFAFKGEGLHDVYFNNNTYLYYPHDFSCNTEFDIGYVENFNKYSKRINRLVKELESNKKILMVYIEHYKLENNFIDINTIINYLNDIRKLYNNNDIYLLYIKHSYYINDEKIYFKNIDDKIHMYLLDNSFDYNNHTEDLSLWCNNFQKINKILSMYNLIND